MESLIGLLVIFLLSAASSWLQKRREANEHSDERPHTPEPRVPNRSIPKRHSAGAEPARRSTWEDQLRELLGGELPGQPPTPRPKYERSAQNAPPPSPPVIIQQAPSSTRLKETEQAYHRAQELHQNAAKRLQEVVNQTKQGAHAPPVLPITPPSREISTAIAQLRSPASVRQALIGSIILGPPKAVEN